MRSALALCLLCACSAPQVVDDLATEAPPAELGRPGVVRAFAQVGSWVGALGGAVAAIAALPVTFPISRLAEEPLGYSRDEFLFAPVTFGASTGHFLLGAPPDLVHFVFYRAWTQQPGEPIEAMQPPLGPGAATSAAPPTFVEPAPRTTSGS